MASFGSMTFPPLGSSQQTKLDPDRESFQPNGNYGILQFDPSKCDSPPIFNEQLTIEAMQKVGVDANDLVKLSPSEMKKIPGNERTQMQIINEIEKRRLDTIDQIKEARQQLIIEQQKKEDFNKKYKMKPPLKSADEKDYERIQRIQKREIEKIIATEFLKQESKEMENERLKRMQNSMRLMEEKNRQKHLEEEKKRKEREEKIIQRNKEKELEYQQQKLKQKEWEEKRKLYEIEQERIRKENALKNEKIKEEKMRKLTEERQRKEKEEKMRLETKQMEELERDKKRIQQKNEELEAIKKQHQLMIEKQMERIAALHQREKEERKRKILKMKEDEKNVEQRMMEYQKKKAEELEETKRKNEEKLQRTRENAKKIEEEDLQRKAAVQLRYVKAKNIYNQINAYKHTRLLALKLESEQRNKEINEKKKKSEEIVQQKIQQISNRMQEKEAKFIELKKKEEEELQNRAALNWLKQRFGEENAKRAQRREQYEKEKTVRELEEKSRAVDNIQMQIKLEHQSRILHSQKIQQQKQKLLNEFNNNIKDGEINLEELAEKYGVNLSEIQKKYSRLRRRETFLTTV